MESVPTRRVTVPEQAARQRQTTLLHRNLQRMRSKVPERNPSVTSTRAQLTSQ